MIKKKPKNIYKTKKINNLFDELEQLAQPSSEEELAKFEQLVINADAINEIIQLMNNGVCQIKSQSQLAEKLGVTEAYISQLFAGKKYVNIPLLQRLQRIFNIRFKIINSRKVIQAPIYIKFQFAGTPENLVNNTFPFSNTSTWKSNFEAQC